MNALRMKPFQVFSLSPGTQCSMWLLSFHHMQEHFEKSALNRYVTYRRNYVFIQVITFDYSEHLFVFSSFHTDIMR